jgi:hypothetical protein
LDDHDDTAHFVIGDSVETRFADLRVNKAQAMQIWPRGLSE